MRKSSNAENLLLTDNPVIMDCEKTNLVFNKGQKKRQSHLKSIPCAEDGIDHILTNINRTNYSSFRAPTKNLPKSNYPLPSVKKVGPIFNKLKSDFNNIKKNQSSSMRQRAHMNSTRTVKTSSPRTSRVSLSSKFAAALTKNNVTPQQQKAKPTLTALKKNSDKAQSRKTSCDPFDSKITKDSLKSYKIPKKGNQNSTKLPNKRSKLSDVKANAAVSGKRKRLPVTNVSYEECKKKSKSKPSLQRTFRKRRRISSSEEDEAPESKKLYNDKQSTREYYSETTCAYTDSAANCANDITTNSTISRVQCDNATVHCSNNVAANTTNFPNQCSNDMTVRRATCSPVQYPNVVAGATNFPNQCSSDMIVRGATCSPVQYPNVAAGATNFPNQCSNDMIVRGATNSPVQYPNNVTSSATSFSIQCPSNMTAWATSSPVQSPNYMTNNTTTSSTIEHFGNNSSTSMDYDTPVPQIEEQTTNKTAKIIDLITLDDDSDDEIEFIQFVPSGKKDSQCTITRKPYEHVNGTVEKLFKKSTGNKNEKIQQIVNLFNHGKKEELLQLITEPSVVCCQCKTKLNYKTNPTCILCKRIFCDAEICQVRHFCVK